MGLKESGLRGSLRNVSVGIDAIPDSVVNQYLGNSFSQGDSGWTDEASSADISLTGDLQEGTIGSGDAIVSDGVDDHGQAPDLFDIETNETKGIAFTIETTVSDRTYLISREDSGTFIRLRVLGSGELDIQQRDNSNRSNNAESTTAVNDGNPHAVILNINSDDANDYNWYIDDATNAEQNVTSNDGFDHTDYTNQYDHHFFARLNDGELSEYLPAKIGEIQINSEPYTETERQNFIDKQPF